MENFNIRRKVSGSFSVCFAFPEKIVLCSSNKRSIAQKIQFRFLADFSTSLYETPVCREIFWKVLRIVLLSQKDGFVFVEQIQHIEAKFQYSIIQNVRITLLVDLQTNLWKLQHEEKLFSKFQSLPHCLKKTVEDISHF